ncbi:MAG: IS66 family insertion sequence element accessory protein TnpB [Thermincola sp.]|nr:IS66 family insertion sequence element accessory protein TnpB [Thermincola sp.]
MKALLTLVQTQLQMDPFETAFMCSCNRACDKCKILHWSNNGWWLYYRKLSRGIFRWKFYENKQVLEVSEREFRWLLDGLSMDQHPHISLLSNGLFFNYIRKKIPKII